MQVAIKTLKHGSSSEDKIKFLQEAAIMAQFRHPNVITLHGVAEKDGQVSATHIHIHLHMFVGPQRLSREFSCAIYVTLHESLII